MQAARHIAVHAAALLAACGWPLGALAQDAASPDEDAVVPEYTVDPRAVAPVPPLVREFKAQYVARQLDLTPPQREQYHELVRTVLINAPQPSVPAFRRLVQAYQHAEATGNEERAARLKAEIEDVRRQALPEGEFFASVRSVVLTESQRPVLDRVLARLDKNPSGAVSPVDVLDYLEQLDLSESQRAQITEAKESLRMRSTTSARKDERFRAGLLETLIARVGAVLSDAQRQALHAHLDRLRPDRLPGIEALDRSYAERPGAADR